VQRTYSHTCTTILPTCRTTLCPSDPEEEPHHASTSRGPPQRRHEQLGRCLWRMRALLLPKGASISITTPS
jgi:hypothetical protein